MTRLACCVAVFVLLAAPRLPSSQAGPAARHTANELVDKLIEPPQSSLSFRAQGTLTRSTRETGAKDVRQIVIKGRIDRAGSSVLYQQVWPVVKGGRAVMLAKTASHDFSGFSYESGRAVRFGRQALGGRFFDSDLLLEDIAETFWSWPSRSLAGEEAVGEHHCFIVDLVPTPRMPAVYGRVRTWVAPELSISLRIDQFDRTGAFLKRLSFYRVLSIENRWVPAIVTAEPADGHSRTVIEGTRFDKLPTLSWDDFTVTGVQKLLQRDR